jgi:hypothetical protein
LNTHEFQFLLTTAACACDPGCFATLLSFGPVTIIGPLETVYDSPSGAIQIAAIPLIFCSMLPPSCGPSSNNVVESASDAVAVFATTLTANLVLKGIPLPGSIMCPAEEFASRLGGVCSEVEMLASDSIVVGSTFRDGSRMCTAHPVSPGGDPIA